MSQSNTTSIPAMIHSRIEKLEHHKEKLLNDLENISDENSLAEAKKRLENFELVLEQYKNNMQPILDSYNQEQNELGRK